MSNYYILTSDGTFVSDDELCHYGVKGQKWGVRRYQNADGTLTDIGKKRQNHTISRINTMYNRSNMWTSRKIDRLKQRGKNTKAAIMEEMKRRNEAAREKHVNAIKKSDAVQYNKMRKEDVRDLLFGGQDYMKRNASHMTTALNRLSEYNMQRGMRWMSNFTLESTLSRMSVNDAYDYLDAKTRMQTAYNRGYNQGVGM